MNLTYEQKERRVVPNWRYFEATLEAGELDEWKINRPKDNSYSIDDYVALWKVHKSLFRAGDLLSAAITNGKEDLPVVKDAASFILDKKEVATHSLLYSAKTILGIEETNRIQSTIEIERLRDCTATEVICKYIHDIRQRIQIIPYNPFLYVDLSRAYLLLGQSKKAEWSMSQALHFGAANRFVARSAARFFLHLQDKDRAYDAIRARGAVAVDPWLMAAEISINMLRGKTSNYVKKGKEIIESGNCRPFGFTELASSIGTLELIEGSNKSSNKLFRKALIDPNDNSLAQVQWVNSFEHLSMNIDSTVQNDYEVKTIEAISKGDAAQAIHEAVNWICDMPFSLKPISVGFDICTILLREFALASAIVDVGLRSDETHPLLLNNKAYCSARSGQLREAKEAIDKLKGSSRKKAFDSLRVCIPATEGLICYRNKQFEEGAKKYNEAIGIAKEKAKELGNDVLYKKAVLNYCRERLIARDGDPEIVMTDVNEIEIQNDNPELKLLFNEVIEEYNRTK